MAFLKFLSGGMPDRMESNGTPMSRDFMTSRHSENISTMRFNDQMNRGSFLGLESKSEIDGGKILVNYTANGAPIYDRKYGNHSKKNEGKRHKKRNHKSALDANLENIDDNERCLLRSPRTSKTVNLALSLGTSHTLPYPLNPNRNILGNPQGNSNTLYRNSQRMASIAGNMHEDQEFQANNIDQSKCWTDTMNSISDPSGTGGPSYSTLIPGLGQFASIHAFQPADSDFTSPSNFSRPQTSTRKSMLSNFSRPHTSTRKSMVRPSQTSDSNTRGMDYNASIIEDSQESIDRDSLHNSGFIDNKLLKRRFLDTGFETETFQSQKKIKSDSITDDLGLKRLQTQDSVDSIIPEKFLHKRQSRLSHEINPVRVSYRVTKKMRTHEEEDIITNSYEELPAKNNPNSSSKPSFFVREAQKRKGQKYLKNTLHGYYQMNKFTPEFFAEEGSQPVRRILDKRNMAGGGYQVGRIAETLSKISENEVKEINSDSSFGQSKHSSPKLPQTQSKSFSIARPQSIKQSKTSKSTESNKSSKTSKSKKSYSPSEKAIPQSPQISEHRYPMSVEIKEAKAPSKVERKLSIDILRLKDRAMITDGLYSRDRCRISVNGSIKNARTKEQRPARRSVTQPAFNILLKLGLDDGTKTEFQELNLFQGLTGTELPSGKSNKRRPSGNSPGQASQSDEIGVFLKDIMSKITTLNEHIISSSCYQQDVTKIWNSTLEKISGNNGMDLSSEKKEMETVNQNFSDNIEKATQILNQTLGFTKKSYGILINSGKTQNFSSNSGVIYHPIRKNASGDSCKRLADRNSEAGEELQSIRGQQTSNMASMGTLKQPSTSRKERVTDQPMQTFSMVAQAADQACSDHTVGSQISIHKNMTPHKSFKKRQTIDFSRTNQG